MLPWFQLKPGLVLRVCCLQTPLPTPFSTLGPIPAPWFPATATTDQHLKSMKAGLEGWAAARASSLHIEIETTVAENDRYLTSGWKKGRINRNWAPGNWKAGDSFNGYLRVKTEHQIQREHRYQVIGSAKRRPQLGILVVTHYWFLTAVTWLWSQLRIGSVFLSSQGRQ